MKPLEEYIAAKSLIRLFDAKESYLRYIRKKIDIDLIQNAGFRILYYLMTAQDQHPWRVLPGIAEIHGEFNPSFGEICRRTGTNYPKPDTAHRGRSRW